MKKGISTLIFVTLAISGVFAQSSDTRDLFSSSGDANFFSGEISIVGGGLRYDRMLSDNFYIGARAFFHLTLLVWEPLSNCMWDTMGIDVIARWKILKKLYAELGLGYGTVGKLSTNYNAASGVLVTPAIGMRIGPSAGGSMFVDLSLGVPVVLGIKEKDSEKTEFGWGINVRPAAAIGLSF